MKFIRNALIGIVIYEAVKHYWNSRILGFAGEAEEPNMNTSPHLKIRKEETDIIKGASQDHLQQLKENAKTHNSASDDDKGLGSQPHTPLNQNADDLMEIGSNPNAALTGHKAEPDRDDPWKNSLADDELRAPDS